MDDFLCLFLLLIFCVCMHSRLHEGTPFNLAQASNRCLRVCGIMIMTAWQGNKSNKVNVCNQAVSKDAWLFFCEKNALPNEISGERFDLNKFYPLITSTTEPSPAKSHAY